MAGRNKTPRAKAEITGAAAKNPARHRATPEVQGVMLGEPSEFLSEFGKAAWVQFKREVPWLKESNRALMEVACHLRGQLFEGRELKSTDVKSYQSILSKIGATPSDEGKIAAALGWAPAPSDPKAPGEKAQTDGKEHQYFDA